MLVDIVAEKGWTQPIQTADAIESWLDNNGYKLPPKPFSIHSEDSIKFMQEIIQPG